MEYDPSTLDSLNMALGTLDLTLEAEMEALGRWSRDFSTLELHLKLGSEPEKDLVGLV